MLIRYSLEWNLALGMEASEEPRQGVVERWREVVQVSFYCEHCTTFINQTACRIFKVRSEGATRQFCGRYYEER